MSVFQDSPQGGGQHELGGLVWEDVEGQESFPVSAGFELTTLGLLVQEHNYSATTHTRRLTKLMTKNKSQHNFKYAICESMTTCHGSVEHYHMVTFLYR